MRPTRNGATPTQTMAAVVMLLVRKPRKISELCSLLDTTHRTIGEKLDALAEEGLVSVTQPERAIGERGTPPRVYTWTGGA
jgi:predicted ArsR family transcriptional regulator